MKSFAKALVHAMSHDNNVQYKPTKKQWQQLTKATNRMRKAGLTFTKEVIEDLAAGEIDERTETYKQFDGFAELDKTLNEIFGE